MKSRSLRPLRGRSTVKRIVHLGLLRLMSASCLASPWAGFGGIRRDRLAEVPGIFPDPPGSAKVPDPAPTCLE